MQQAKLTNLERRLDQQSMDLKNDALKESAKFTQRLERKLPMMVLVNKAMWEILEDKIGVTPDELASKVTEIDLRDGVTDGKFKPAPMDCPECDAKICNDFRRCLFCGYEPKDSSVFDSLS